MQDVHFAAGAFTEAELEQAILQLFQAQGYEYTPGDAIARTDERDVLIEDDLRAFLADVYAPDHFTEAETARLIQCLRGVAPSPLYEANRTVFRMVTEGFDFARDDASAPYVHVAFLDFDHVERNRFRVVNQFTVRDGEAERRPDALLFVNGIPLVICEFKSAIRENATLADAWRQVHVRYERDIPELMKYTALSMLCDGPNTKLGTLFTPYVYYYAWNKANEHDTVANGVSSLFTMIEGAFAKDRLLAILRDFVFYPDGTKAQAMVCRYPQFFGANRMFASIGRALRPAGDGKGGTYFGATGCGKTILMLFLTRLVMLRDAARFQNPTVLVIVDRDDLAKQTTELFVTAKTFLHDENVQRITSRNMLLAELKERPAGGVYVMTIQQFCEDIGLLSTRSNILCISDEAHRTQTGVGEHLVQTERSIETRYGFAKYLRDSFPQATYVGFTGTPVDATMAVFGDVVDRYTMKEASDDGITVRIAYEPRLARVNLSSEKTAEIDAFYQKCAEAGSSPEQIEESKRAMSRLSVILGDPERLRRVAADIVHHYEDLCALKPKVVQKAMIVCSTREIAYELLQDILALRPAWGEPRRAEDEAALTPEELQPLKALPKINLVATRGKDDAPGLYTACGTKQYRQMLDAQFKLVASNFRIAIVVDMWITGFDVPSLAVMYIDKPLQRHTLIQTISRVNRIFDGKDRGLVVDYIGIKGNMMAALKQYGGKLESSVDELDVTLAILRNHLALLADLMTGFDATPFFGGDPLTRLRTLGAAADFVQQSEERQRRYMALSQRLKGAFTLCEPSGRLTDEETKRSEFYLAVRSVVYKTTKPHVPDAEMMNRVVEQMVAEAISCTGVEDILSIDTSVDIFSDDFLAQVQAIRLPMTKFQALLKLVSRAIRDYSRTNKLKAKDFQEMLQKVVDQYNHRDHLVFTSAVVTDFVDNLSDELIEILRQMQVDRASFADEGITFEEKAFYDILVRVRDEHAFEYADADCKTLAKEIKKLVDTKVSVVDWASRDDIKSSLRMDLIVLLYEHHYPPEWNDEVFHKVLEQAENYKKHQEA